MSYAVPMAPLPVPLVGPLNGQHSLPVRTGNAALADPTLHGATSHARLAEVAKRLYEVRQMREGILGDALFSEPAWDIMLDLFISAHEGRQLSVSAVCIGAHAPSATALRYLTMLQDADLVERTRDERDGRRSHVQLSPLGRRRMANLLARLVE